MAGKIIFPSHLKELRIHLCQKSASSEGVRTFIEKNYVSLKKANPQTPILIRECSGIVPKIYARFDMGREASVLLTDLKMQQVSNSLISLVQQN